MGAGPLLPGGPGVLHAGEPGPDEDQRDAKALQVARVEGVARVVAGDDHEGVIEVRIASAQGLDEVADGLVEILKGREHLVGDAGSSRGAGTVHGLCVVAVITCAVNGPEPARMMLAASCSIGPSKTPSALESAASAVAEAGAQVVVANRPVPLVAHEGDEVGAALPESADVVVPVSVRADAAGERAAEPVDLPGRQVPGAAERERRRQARDDGKDRTVRGGEALDHVAEAEALLAEPMDVGHHVLAADSMVDERGAQPLDHDDDHVADAETLLAPHDRAAADTPGRRPGARAGAGSGRAPARASSWYRVVPAGRSRRRIRSWSGLPTAWFST